MKSKVYLTLILYLFFQGSGSLFCIGEKTVSLGGEAIWRMASYRAGITEINLVRSNPVLVLSTEGRAQRAPSVPDLQLSFDEGHIDRFRDASGRYRIYTLPMITAVDNRYARAGNGAVLFSGSDHSHITNNSRNPREVYGPLTIKPENDSALFAGNTHIGDFTLEFWLYPQHLENGEQILLWISSLPEQSTVVTGRPTADHTFQRILCLASKNRLQWSFIGFFLAPDAQKRIDIIMTGKSAIVPKIWSHHLIRFDSVTGMIEYAVNGQVEAIDYTTPTRREGGEVYTPIAGEDGMFVLGDGFSGMMDEFKIHGSLAPTPAMQKYPLRGGRIETTAIDLGDGSNGVIKLEASGGRMSIRNARTVSEYKRNGRFLFSDDSEMQFFIRGSNNPHRWDSAWRSVTPGADIEEAIVGRYVQLAVDFYPSADGESSPYLEELRVTYYPDEPPLPPAQLTAVAIDGAVQLQWRNSPDSNTRGYLVYYGTSGDDYFGEDSSMGVSPIDVGRRNSVTIEGLKNGTLYYFRVAAYSYKGYDNLAELQSGQRHIGEFSREVRARPLTGITR
jgi:hypothetical protein